MPSAEPEPVGRIDRRGPTGRPARGFVATARSPPCRNQASTPFVLAARADLVDARPAGLDSAQRAAVAERRDQVARRRPATPSTNPPLRPLGPPPQMSCSSSTTSMPGSSSFRNHAVHIPVYPPPRITTSAVVSLGERRRGLARELGQRERLAEPPAAARVGRDLELGCRAQSSRASAGPRVAPWLRLLPWRPPHGRVEEVDRHGRRRATVPRSWEVTEGPAARPGPRDAPRRRVLARTTSARPRSASRPRWNEVTPCNYHLDKLAALAKEGVRQGGAVPIEFTTIAVSDGIAMGHEGMKASLMSRDLIADSVELVMHAERMDALVGIAGCDKSEPGMLMAMARMNLPSVYLYGGTILPGTYKGKDITIQDVFEAVGAHAKGTIDDDELLGDRARGLSRAPARAPACTPRTRWPRSARRSGCRCRASPARPPSTTAARCSRASPASEPRSSSPRAARCRATS